MKIEPIEGSETSAIINQTPGNYPKENLLYSVHCESLKSRMVYLTFQNSHNVIIYIWVNKVFREPKQCMLQ